MDDDDDMPLLIGQKVQHKFQDNGEESWWTGRVLSQVKTIPGLHGDWLLLLLFWFSIGVSGPFSCTIYVLHVLTSISCITSISTH